MKKNKIVLSIVFSFSCLMLQDVVAQSPTPSPATQVVEVSRERREQSYAKLLEAQRYMWGMSRTRSQPTITAAAKLAKQSLQKAIELNPNLAEAYTALAEISLSTPPNDIDEAILLANIAVKLNPDNFGSRKILARVYTIKSQLPTTNLESTFVQKAITEWKEVVRLDPRFAEGWAFLSEFYDRTHESEKRIDALKKWMASASPIETRFYRTILGTGENLSPESAGLKLGEALVKAGKSSEAVEILSQRVADDPDNPIAIDLLRQSLESSEGESTPQTLELLQRAVFANPTNLVLVEMLAEVQLRLGKMDDAVKTLNNTIQGIKEEDKLSKANLQVLLGDVYAQSNRNDDAVKSYEQSLNTFGIEKVVLTTEDQREFATKVFEKLIKVYKTAGKSDEAKATIERARFLLGKADLFADKQLISFFMESGKKEEALQTVRLVRKNFGDDYSLIRTEATILTNLGRVDEGVALIKSLMAKKSAVPSAYYDDFSNYIFISSLYSQAKRSKDAILTAQKAFGVAQNEERRQIASLSLATAQYQSGNHLQAEKTLREILKKTPNNPMALNNLGYYLLERDEDVDEAVSLIEKAVKIDPTNPSYLDSLGWGYYKLGKLTEAEKYLKEALRYNNSSATIHEHLGDVYQKQGRFSLAKSAWQKALVLSSDTKIAARIKEKMTNAQ